MEEHEIISVPSEEHRRGSHELKATKISTSNSENDAPEDPAKSLHKYHLISSPVAIIACIILKATLGSDGIVVWKMGIIPLLVMAGLYVVLQLCARYTPDDLQTYFMTVAVVADDYALLVMINMEYIEIAIIPVLIIFFVGALATKVRGNQRGKPTSEYGSESAELIKMAMMPYLLQLLFLIWTQYSGQQDIIFSDFLLFFSSVLCALAVMMSSPPVGVTPVSAQVMPVMHKTCIIVIMITAQTMTTEWLGQDIIFVCMPELIAVLLCIPFDHADLGVSMRSVMLGKWSYFLRLVEAIISVFVRELMKVLDLPMHLAGGAAVGVRMSSTMSGRWGRYFVSLSSPVGIVALLLSGAYPNDESNISQASWLVRLFCISSSCSALSHFHVWLLHQWPANSNGLIQLLNDSSTIIFRTSRTLCFATMISMVISVGPWTFLLHEATWPAVALLLVPFIFSRDQQLHVQHRAEYLHKYSVIEEEAALSHMISLLNKKLEKLLLDEELSEYIEGGIRNLQGHFNSMLRVFPRTATGWIKDRVGLQVDELVYDMDDWLDLLLTQQLVYSERCGTSFSWSWLSRWYPSVRIKQVMELKHFQRRVGDVKVRLDLLINKLATEDVPRSMFSFAPPLAVHSSSTQLVGVDGPREKVVKMMVPSARSDRLRRMVCIVGMVGSGKTTLAREVYKHLGENFKFDCCLSVSVGPRREIAKVFQHMLFELGLGIGDAAGDAKNDTDGDFKLSGDAGEVNRLAHRLRSHLKDKRYLVMVDDLGGSDTWALLMRDCFPENNLGSSIIATTEAAFPRRDVIYRTLPLDDAEARKLFNQRTFGDSLKCPDDLKDVSDKILRKCGGLPLALVSVGDTLANMPRTQDAFESFLKSGAFYRAGLQGQPSFQVETMRQIIGQSYSNLPADLRACLLHLSIFPENYEMETKYLLRLWIAEGFISGHDGLIREETQAEKYIDRELVARNLIQFQSTSDLNDDVNRKICVLHPVIRDFIVGQAMEENFVTIAQPGNNFDRDRTVRRLSILDEVEEGIDLSHARSVIVFGHARRIPPLTKLSVVRVLDLEDYKGTVCLDGLCKLVLLRYLNLRGTDVSELPENIGDLRSLQTLDVRSTRVKELPLSIVKLKKLVHLLAGNAKSPINGIHEMKALRTMSCAIVGNSSASFLDEISQIGGLRELELFCNPTQVSADEKQDEYYLIETSGMCNAPQFLERVRIHSSFPSLKFQRGGFRMVKVLELKFGSTDTPAVSGLECLPWLSRVLVDQDDGIATLQAVSDAAKLHKVYLEVEQVRWEEFY